MDNLGSHNGEAVRQAIRSAGAKLFFLPKSSPDLNPIEQVFAKFKHLLRKAAARTLETVVAAIGELLGAYTAQGVRQLLQERRIRTNLNSSRSSLPIQESSVKNMLWVWGQSEGQASRPTGAAQSLRARVSLEKDSRAGQSGICPAYLLGLAPEEKRFLRHSSRH